MKALVFSLPPKGWRTDLSRRNAEKSLPLPVGMNGSTADFGQLIRVMRMHAALQRCAVGSSSLCQLLSAHLPCVTRIASPAVFRRGDWYA